MHLNNGVHAESVTDVAHIHVVPFVTVPEAPANSERRDGTEKQARVHLFSFMHTTITWENVRPKKGRLRRTPRRRPSVWFVEISTYMPQRSCSRPERVLGTCTSCGTPLLERHAPESFFALCLKQVTTNCCTNCIARNKTTPTNLQI